jgi:hypothetical protein
LSPVTNVIGKLTATDGRAYDSFGSELSISNNRIVVCAYGYNNETGAAYLLEDPSDPQLGREYSQLAILTASGYQW